EHQGDDDVDSCISEASRFESPLAGRKNRFLVESTGVQRAKDANVRRDTIGPNDEFEHNSALDSFGQGSVGVLRLDLGDDARGCHGAAGPVDPSTDTSARPWADPETESGTNPCADTFTHTTARTRSCRHSERHTTDWKSQLLCIAGRERPCVED